MIDNFPADLAFQVVGGIVAMVAVAGGFFRWLMGRIDLQMQASTEAMRLHQSVISDALRDHQDREERLFNQLFQADRQQGEVAERLNSRIAKLELVMAESPGRQDIHALALEVRALHGQISSIDARLGARLDSQDVLIRRVDEMARRQEDFLLSKGV